MKKINKSIKLIALLVVCMAMPTLAGAQVLKNAYFNVDWQINSPFGCLLYTSDAADEL